MAEYLEVSLLNLNTSFSSFTDDVMDGKAILYGDSLTYHSYCVQLKKFKDAWLDDSSNMWEQIIAKGCQPFLCCLIVSTRI